MTNLSNVVITDNVQNKSIVIPYDEYNNNILLFTGTIGKKMINKLIANKINFTLIEG